MVYTCIIIYIQWTLSIVGTHWTDQSVVILEVVLYTKATFGTPESVLIIGGCHYFRGSFGTTESAVNIEVSLFWRVLIREVPM